MSLLGLTTTLKILTGAYRPATEEPPYDIISLSDEIVGQCLISLIDSTFELSNGKKYEIYHDYDCCESCNPICITGNINEILNIPLTAAWITEDSDPPSGDDAKREYSDSYTWSHINFQAGEKLVTIHWLGESNGYYGETIDIKRIK